MKPPTSNLEIIVQIKQDLWGNVACILFLVGLSAGTLWLSVHLGQGYNPIALFCCAIWILVCFIPISEIRNPKTRVVGIEDSCLVWMTFDNRSGESRKQKVPLHLIETVNLILPRVVGEPGARHYPLAQFCIVTRQGQNYEIPTSFFPGVHQRKIIKAIQEHVPGVRVLERLGDEKAVLVAKPEPPPSLKVTCQVWLVGILALGFSAGMTTLMLKRVVAGLETRNWAATQGVVEHITRESFGDSQTLDVAYTYSANDRTFTSKEVGPRLFAPTEDLRQGEIRTVFYNPKAPERAVLFTGTGVLDLLFTIIPISVAGAAVFVLWGFLRRKDFRRAICRLASTSPN